MKIYCVRHGEAQAVIADPDKPLTDKGEADIAKIAALLAKQDVHVQHVMHSGIGRAKRTAEILAQQLMPDQITECENLLNSESVVDPLVEMIQTWSEDTMLVGHLPFMALLVNCLVTGSEATSPLVNYPPGTMVCLEYMQQGRWIINWVLRPDIVPE